MFNLARLKLTGWYLLIIMFVSLVFSSIIYFSQTVEIDRLSSLQRIRMERRLQERGFTSDLKPKIIMPTIMDPELIADSKGRLVTTLILIDGTILIFSGILGFFLAGRTLNPIKLMLEDQNRFISDASHELRTPLTALKSSMEVYLRDKKATLRETKELIQDSVGQVNKLQALTDNLLLLTRHQKINQKNFEKTSLLEISTLAVSQLQPLAKEKGITIKNKVININFQADKTAILNLLIILLDNSIKYSKKNGVVDITSRTSGVNLIISVSDKGLGIDKKDLPHIFDRFFRSDQARSKTEANGYGLGLSIAKEIVANHNGTIDCVSRLGQGATFVVKLPINQKLIIKPPSNFSWFSELLSRIARD